MANVAAATLRHSEHIYERAEPSTLRTTAIKIPHSTRSLFYCCHELSFFMRCISSPHYFLLWQAPDDLQWVFPGTDSPTRWEQFVAARPEPTNARVEATALRTTV